MSLRRETLCGAPCDCFYSSVSARDTLLPFATQPRHSAAHARLFYLGWGEVGEEYITCPLNRFPWLQLSWIGLKGEVVPGCVRGGEFQGCVHSLVAISFTRLFSPRGWGHS